MKITIDGKQVWPPRGRAGLHSYAFEKSDDGGIKYMEFPLDARGEAVKDHPTVIVEISKSEFQRLARRLVWDKEPDNQKVGAELEEGAPKARRDEE
jgi:hypothetical protein